MIFIFHSINRVYHTFDLGILKHILPFQVKRVKKLMARSYSPRYSSEGSTVVTESKTYPNTAPLSTGCLDFLYRANLLLAINRLNTILQYPSFRASFIGRSILAYSGISGSRLTSFGMNCINSPLWL